jgi:hypothetical protein
MKSVPNKWLPGKAVTWWTRQLSGSPPGLALLVAKVAEFWGVAGPGDGLQDICPAAVTEKPSSRPRMIPLEPTRLKSLIAISTFEKETHSRL